MTQYSGKVIRRNPVTPTQQSASGVWKLTDQAAAIRNNTWPIAGVPDPISRSVRLRSSASAYFNRTPAIAGNRTTWTFSAWIKRGALGGTYRILQAATTATPSTDDQYFSFLFNSSDQLACGLQTVNAFVTSQVFRDPSAWYHFVLVADTTNATSSNRIQLYVNGSRVTAFSSSATITQNQNLALNSTSSQTAIGREILTGSSGPFDGYLTEINFIDGQALTPSSFGTTDSLTGAWIPLPYTGTYGTNGFYLDFRDNTSTTTLGLDYSGNSNNWTANNISLTAGSTYDSMLDVPTPWIGYSATTDTSAVTRGNYCTANPLLTSNNITFSNANLSLDVGATGGVYRNAGGTFAQSTGKWYWEFAFGNTVANPLGGVGDVTQSRATWESDTTGNANFWYVNAINGNKVNAGSTSYGSSFLTTDICMVALDMDNGRIWWGKNGTWFASGDPAAGTNAAFTNLTGKTLAPVFFGGSGSSGGNSYTLNFGQRPFSYAPPSGFKTLCATNLPTPTILNGAQFMAATLYTGTGSSQTIANTVNGVNFQPDLVWMKSRSAATDHGLYDAVRGVQLQLESNTTTAETTETTGLTAFTSTGFTVGALAQLNTNTATYVGWQWNAGGSNATNTSGTITSTVRASTTAGFSVVTFTGNGSTGTVGHGLGVAPRMIIQKPRNSTGSWAVYHASLGAGNAVWLNLTDASASYPTVWNSTTPTSSVYSVGSYMGTSNYVAYCFAQIAGYSAFGSYTGNGSTDGPFVFTGFRPRWVMFKRTDTTGNWLLYDTSRLGYNQSNNYLLPDLSNAEGSGDNFIDILSNGFKARVASQSINVSGGTYIFAAFAENPFKYSNAR